MATPAPSADERAIRAMIATWLAASKTGDTATVLSLMSDDVVFLMPGRPPLRGKAEFAAMQAGMAGFRIEATGTVQEVRATGDWAWCWTALEVTVTPRDGGPPVRRAGHTLSVLQRLQGRWVIARDANMLTVVG